MRRRSLQVHVLLAALLVCVAASISSGCPGTLPPPRPAPPVLGPVNDLFTVNELVGTVTVVVARHGRTDRAVSVEYATVDGTASAGVDYTAVSGTLDWPTGDGTTRMIDIPISDNAAADGNRTFTVSLSNPVGATIIGASQAEVTITDDDAWGAPGDPDRAFGKGGVVTSDPADSYESARAASLDGTHIYVVGSAGIEWRIEKRSVVDGSLDAAFGAGGIVTAFPPEVRKTPTAVAIDPTHLYVIGSEDGAGSMWRIEKRVLASGDLDPGFGLGGVVTSDPSPGHDEAYGMATSTSHMYLVGTDEVPGQRDWRWRVEKRSLADGSLDVAFGLGGVVTFNPTTEWDAAVDVVLDASHLYAVGGIKGPGMAADYLIGIQKRSLADGSLDPVFGTGGTITSDPSSGDDRPFAAAIDASHLYVGGWDGLLYYQGWRVEKRSLADGSLDGGFGAAGVLTIAPGNYNECLYDLQVDAGLLYLVGSSSTSRYGDLQWRLERRAVADGSRDAGFGVGGVVEYNPSGAWDRPQGLVIDGSAIYICGYDSIPCSWRWRVEKRLK